MTLWMIGFVLLFLVLEEAAATAAGLGFGRRRAARAMAAMAGIIVGFVVGGWFADAGQVVDDFLNPCLELLPLEVADELVGDRVTRGDTVYEGDHCKAKYLVGRDEVIRVERKAAHAFSKRHTAAQQTMERADRKGSELDLTDRAGERVHLFRWDSGGHAVFWTSEDGGVIEVDFAAQIREADIRQWAVAAHTDGLTTPP